MSKVALQVVQQATPSTTRPWFLIETTITTDGYRTRVCEGRWATQEEAEASLARRQLLADGPRQEFLEELYEYLDNRADVAADCPDGTTPNAEARLLEMLRRTFPEVAS